MEENKLELYKALANFQQTCPIVHKATEGYGYSYATLDSIIRIINPVMSENGLGFTQLLEGQSLKTIIFHTSGASIESSVDIPQNVKLAKMNEFQVLGSAITYLRRYALSSMLGIITDKDLDASGEQVESNGFEDPNIDPSAQGEKLRQQVIARVVAFSMELEPKAPIQSQDLANDSLTSVTNLYNEYKANLNDLRANNWIDQQMSMPKKSGSLGALRELVKEAKRRGFYTPSVELKLKQKADEYKAVEK